MPSVNNRNWTPIKDDAELTSAQTARADALARRWSELHHQEEQEGFERQRMFEDDGYIPDACCDEVVENGTCEHILGADAARRLGDELQREEMERIEEKLAELGLRMMRPYEHHNEDERYHEYMERERY